MSHTSKFSIIFVVLFINCSAGVAPVQFVDSEHTYGKSASSDVALGDIDGDGDLDAFVINGEWNVVQPNQVWINNGKGIFTESIQRFEKSRAGIVELADLDSDGDLDAFIAYYNFTGGEPNQVWFNDGKGSFTDSGQRMGNRNGGAALADLDGDGDLDAFNCNHVIDNNGSFINGGHEIWLNDGKGFFSNSGQDLGNGWNTGIVLGDFDNDGDQDAVITFNAGDDGNLVWLNDGHARFTDSGQILSMDYSMGLNAGDLDGDKDIDLVILHPDKIRIWLNDGKGIFMENGQTIIEKIPPRSVALADLDKDGDLDAFVASGKWQTRFPAKVWVNDGHGHFTDSGLLLGNDESQKVAIGDLDGDGDPDAFVANTGGCKVYFNVTGE